VYVQIQSPPCFSTVEKERDCGREYHCGGATGLMPIFLRCLTPTRSRYPGLGPAWPELQNYIYNVPYLASNIYTSKHKRMHCTWQDSGLWWYITFFCSIWPTSVGLPKIQYLTGPPDIFPDTSREHFEDVNKPKSTYGNWPMKFPGGEYRQTTYLEGWPKMVPGRQSAIAQATLLLLFHTTYTYLSHGFWVG
jgi:hypothetical protein